MVDLSSIVNLAPAHWKTYVFRSVDVLCCALVVLLLGFRVAVVESMCSYMLAVLLLGLRAAKVGLICRCLASCT